MSDADLILAERVAREAGAALLERFRRPARGVESKSSATDMVSDADREAEETITELLRRERPADGILAEEGSTADSDSGRRWVIDPLDGTTNYLYGHPAWCVSIALEERDGALAGVVHAPASGETFTASRRAGAWLNGEAISVTGKSELATSLVATGFGYDAGRRAAQSELLRTVLPRVRDIRRMGAAAIDLAWVAAGRLDGYYERGLNAWDWAAGALLVEEAGGIVRSLPGEPHGLVAAGPALIDALEPVVSGWPAGAAT